MRAIGKLLGYGKRLRRSLCKVKNHLGVTLQSKNIALLPIVVISIAIVITLFFDFSEIIFNPPNLAFALNLIFWSTATLSIAYVSAKSFVSEGSAIVLIISVSILVFGLSFIIAGWASSFSGNYSASIGNIGALVASSLQVLAAILSYKGKTESKIKNRKKAVVLIYTVTVLFVLAISIIVTRDYLPSFLNASGPTLVRQVVLGLAISFFALACLLFLAQYLRSKSLSLYLYAIAIGLFSVGLTITLEVKAIGDLPTWLGRIVLYLAAIYLTLAIIETRQKPSSKTVAGAWAESFRSNPKQVNTFFSRMLNSFAYCKILADKAGKPIDLVFLDANEAFEKNSGLKKGHFG